MRETKRILWESWIDRYVDSDDPTPLFATVDGDGERSGDRLGDDATDGPLTVALTDYGTRRKRPVLTRSDAMNARLFDAVETVVEDHERREGDYDGIVYLMYGLDGSRVIPYYIGKSGMFGRADGRLSANLRNISETGGKFARWGYGDAYHLGDLSAAVLDACDDIDTTNHSDPKGKYRRWAAQLFEPRTHRLRQPVYFWVSPWDRSEGPYPDTYPYLAELEYQLVGIAYELFPETLLNTEGVPNNPTEYAKLRGWIDDERTSLDDFADQE
ncbi:hypothetical protein [Halobellus captivus]|uniref:hypothetical protein n=1 Tax=Halobellus captivus TaxID=2592614 RepID=UPI0011A0F872|nr:hypothetical protein [Halobellus captivus]